MGYWAWLFVPVRKREEVCWDLKDDAAQEGIFFALGKCSGEDRSDVWVGNTACENALARTTFHSSVGGRVGRGGN